MGIFDKIKKVVKGEENKKKEVEQVEPKEPLTPAEFEQSVMKWEEIDKEECPKWLLKLSKENPEQSVRILRGDKGRREMLEIDCLPELLNWPGNCLHLLDDPNYVECFKGGVLGIRFKPLDRPIKTKMDLIYEIKKLNNWNNDVMQSRIDYEPIIKIFDASKNCYMTSDTVKHYGKEYWREFVESDACQLVLGNEELISNLKLPAGVSFVTTDGKCNLSCEDGMLNGNFNMPVLIEGKGMLKDNEPDEIILTPQQESLIELGAYTRKELYLEIRRNRMFRAHAEEEYWQRMRDGTLQELYGINSFIEQKTDDICDNSSEQILDGRK